MRNIRIIVGGLAMGLLLGNTAWGQGQNQEARVDPSLALGEAMADAATRLLASLDANQRERAVFEFDSPERWNWHWIPRERKGVSVKELRPDQLPLLYGFLATGLSTRGNLTAVTIMTLEQILHEQEGGGGPVRDPSLYFMSVFGQPGDPAGWGWRFEGHHLSLNFTLKENRVVAATPFMLGSNPATVKEGSRQGLRNLATIETPLDQLLGSLSEEQKQKAVTAATAPSVTSTPNSAQIEPSRLEGLGPDDLTPKQQQQLANIVRAYAAMFAPPVEASLLEELERNQEQLHLSWSGPVDRSQSHAFRILGPTLLIDFNNTQNEANHIHTFYRSVEADFGL